jgi:hypothetical protein
MSIVGCGRVGCRAGEDAAHEVGLRVLLLPGPAELAPTMPLRGVDHREVGPSERELEKLEQQRVPAPGWPGDPAREPVEVLESDPPDREHLADGDVLAATGFAGCFEEALLGARVGRATVVESVQDRFVLAADELADRLGRHGVVGAHQPRVLDRPLDRFGDLSANVPQQLAPCVERDAARRCTRFHGGTLPHPPRGSDGAFHRRHRTRWTFLH